MIIKRIFYSRLILLSLLCCGLQAGFSQKWFMQNSGTTSDLLDVHFFDENTGWVVGTDKTLLKTLDGGVNWTPIAVPFGAASTSFRGVFFINESKGWIVGEDGFIVRTIDGGNSWINDQTVGAGTDLLTDVHFVDDNRGWVTASFNMYRTTNGGTVWDSTYRIPSYYGVLIDVHFVDASNGWAMTNSFTGIIRTTDGGVNWEIVPDVGIGGVWPHIFFINPQVGWFVTGSISEGKIGKTLNGGLTWSVQTLTDGTLLWGSMDFIDENFGWAVGSDIWITTDGGTKWILQEELGYFHDVDFVNQTKGWAVGEGGEIWQFDCRIPVTNIDTTICQGESVWVGNIEHQQAGQYQYTLAGSYSCDSVVVLNLTVIEEKAMVAEDITTCRPDTVLIAQTPGDPLIEGEWSQLNTTASIYSPNNAQSRVTDLESGENYFIWTISHPVCPNLNSDTLLVNYLKLSEADAGPDFTVCQAETQLDALMLPDPITGKWTTNTAGVVFSDRRDPNATVSPLVPGENYFTWTLSHPSCANFSSEDVVIYYEDGEIMAMDDHYFPALDTIMVKVTDNDLFPDPGAIRVSIIESTDLNKDVGTLNMDAFGNLFFYLSSPTNVISRKFTYRIEHESCPELYDEAAVKLDFTQNNQQDNKEDLSLVITPNGDGKNDQLIIPELAEQPEGFPNNSLVVINRWGDVVFQAKPYNNDWQGTHYKTKEKLPPGTYFYIARLNLAEGIVRKERVTLIR